MGRVPEVLAGAAMLPAPVAESESWLTAAPAVFHALATAVSDLPACSVAPAPGKVIATCSAVRTMAGEEAAAAETAVPALASVPAAPALAVKLPSDCAVYAT